MLTAQSPWSHHSHFAKVARCMEREPEKGKLPELLREIDD